MRDVERTIMYYTFGTIDWHSEMALKAGNKSSKAGGVYGGVRFVKLAGGLYLAEAGTPPFFISFRTFPPP